MSSSAPLPRPEPPERPRPVVFGVLGGIASGKSAVAARLAGPGGRVIDADRLAREVLGDPELARDLAQAFGEGVFGPAGVDREALARAVFDDPEARDRLEGWIHPRVRARILAALAEAEAQGTERVALDVPLLLENDSRHGLVARCDHLVFVDAPLEERERRAIEHRGWAPGEVARREAAQLPLDQKRARADFVISNTRSPAELDAAVDQILAELGLARN